VTGLLLDEAYPPSLARSLCDRGHDVVAVLDIEVGLASRSDDDVPAWAARNGRCVVTENISDFARLNALGATHSGIVFVSAQRFPRTRTGLARLDRALDALIVAKNVPGEAGVVWLAAEPE
jgi:predicted nuclease of predicted toxin-antitoxin system